MSCLKRISCLQHGQNRPSQPRRPGCPGQGERAGRLGSPSGRHGRAPTEGADLDLLFGSGCSSAREPSSARTSRSSRRAAADSRALAGSRCLRLTGLEPGRHGLCRGWAVVGATQAVLAAGAARISLRMLYLSECVPGVRAGRCGWVRRPVGVEHDGCGVRRPLGRPPHACTCDRWRVLCLYRIA